MNQILEQKNKNQHQHKIKYKVEISDDIFDIPYGKVQMMKDINTKYPKLKLIWSKRKYQIQFIISFIIATIFLLILFWKIYQMNQYEKISDELLKQYQLTTLYQSSQNNVASSLSSSNTTDNPSFQNSNNFSNPFVIGMIKIDKIKLNYPILSESNYDLLKISLCRFAGPMPNEVGNLCVAGHNYVDNRFFSRLHELKKNDIVEIYDLNGKKISYKVTQKYEVRPDDLSCTSQEVNNKKIVTLLTCNNVTSKRTIIKAEEIV